MSISRRVVELLGTPVAERGQTVILVTHDASVAEDVMHSANLGLDFVRGLTMAMAWFIVGNAMLMNVTKRRRGFSLLRLLGATGRQVRRFVTSEAAILGAIGAGAARGLLRTVGMTGGQVTRMVVPESLLLGIDGALIGLLGGIVTALFIQMASQPLLGHPIRPSFRPGVVAANMAAAVAITMLAAWLPARRAARLDLLEAISAE